MEYRRFGRTNLQMPVFSCGGMRYQYKWQDVPLSEIPKENQSNIEATIRRSIELGINHLETARYYGTSEMQLGEILPQFDREKLIIQTKIPPHENPAKFREDFEKSLNYLKLDYVDLCGIHGINNLEIFDQTFKENGCLNVAKQLQKEGKIRYLGFSTHAPTNNIIEAINTGEFDYVNLHWYWIYQKNWAAIEAATRQDMGVFIISPSNKGGMLYKPSEKLVKLCHPLSPLVFNDLFCLSHPQIHTLSIGVDKPSDFDEHLKTLNLLDKADQILPEIIERLETEAINILGKNWFENWHKNLPSYEDTPNNINMQTILWLRNLAIAYDLIEYGKMRYNLLGNADHWFPGNRANDVKNYDLTECLKNSSFSKEIPEYLAEADLLLGGEAVKRLSQSD